MPCLGREWVGIPYQQGGADIRGCSCWGLVRLFYREHFLIGLPDIEAGDPLPKDWRLVRPFFAAEFGDVLLFDRPDGPHVAIALGHRDMLHVDECTTSRIERLDSWIWRDRLRAVYRHKNLYT